MRYFQPYRHLRLSLNTIYILGYLCDSEIYVFWPKMRQFQMYVDFIYAWLYMGVWLSLP